VSTDYLLPSYRLYEFRFRRLLRDKISNVHMSASSGIPASAVTKYTALDCVPMIGHHHQFWWSWPVGILYDLLEELIQPVHTIVTFFGLRIDFEPLLGTSLSFSQIFLVSLTEFVKSGKFLELPMSIQSRDTHIGL
jgi:hypothetical protein